MPEEKGLPMTAKWDPEKLQQEVAALKELAGKPLLQRAGGYLKRTGPGLLQSAMTLGAGSAAASVVAGAYYGYSFLWVQPVAMFLGICMLGALANVVLTTGERPYRAFGREIHVSIAFLWALGTIVASVIWHFPQYGLAAGAFRDLLNLAGVVADQTVTNTAGKQEMVITPLGYAASFGIGFAILGINIFTTWNYGSHTRGIRLYEWFLRLIIASVIVCFAFVVLKTGFDWEQFKANHYGLGFPADTKEITTVLGALGAAVGINMTFLYPYSLLAKGWGKHHKALARWDLVMSMFLPFVLVTSLVIIAVANTIYPYQGELTPVGASRALTSVMGPIGRVIFDLGFIGMTCGAISTHMVVCGFTVCEMFGLEYTVWRYRLFTLVPAVGLLGVVTKTPLWMPVAASAICLTMLPIAYLCFLIMNNKRSYIGDAVGCGWKRVLSNVLLVLALAAASIGAAVKINMNVVHPIRTWLLKSSPAAEQPADAQSASSPAKPEGAQKSNDQ